MTPEQFDDFSRRLSSLEKDVASLKTEIRIELVPLKAWMNKSEEFHIETRRNWDTFRGRQEAEAKLQAERHEQNQVAIAQSQQITTKVANKIALAMLFVTIIMALGALVSTWIAYNAGRKQVSLEKLLSHGFDSVYASEQDSSNPPH